MHHAYLDKFASGHSPLHRCDARAKTIAFLALLAAAIIVPVGLWWPFAVLAAVLLALWLPSGVPAGYLVKRVFLLSPLIIFSLILFPFLRPGEIIWSGHLGPWPISVSRQGLEFAGNIAVKFAFSVLVLGLLFSVTRFHEFLAALRRFGVPAVLVMQLGFLYRYLFVIHDEAERLTRARDARSAGRGGFARWRLWQAGGAMLGSLLLRSFGRSRRIYSAMLARGFSGEVLVLAPRDRTGGASNFSPADAALVAAVLAASVATTLLWAFSNHAPGAAP
jgi:cobalt/nickel transport system permease protein